MGISPISFNQPAAHSIPNRGSLAKPTSSVFVNSTSLLYPELLTEAMDEVLLNNTPKASQLTRFYLNHNANPNLISVNGRPYLSEAVLRNRPSLFRMLLRTAKAGDKRAVKPSFGPQTINLDQVDRLGTTPLMQTLLSNHPEAAQELIRNRANVTLRDRGGRTALDWAALLGQPEMTEWLIQAQHLSPEQAQTYRAQADQQFGRIQECRAMPLADRNNAFYTAASQRDLPATVALLAAGAEINARNEEGSSPLDEAILHDGRTNIISALIQLGADVNAKDNMGFTPLHIAAFSGNAEAINILSQANADIEAVATQENFTPLHMAVINDHLDAINALLRAHANVEAITREGQAPLHMAASNNNSDAINVLLQANANIEVATPEGFTPLHVAAINSRLDAIHTLLGAGANIEAPSQAGYTPLHHAALYGHSDAIHVLLQAHADIEAITLAGFTPLHLAAINDQADAIHTLALAGANVHVFLNDHHDTVLHLAATRGSINAISALIQEGVPVEVTSLEGYTPLHLAATYNQSDAVHSLAAAGADTNAVDAGNHTPLHLAASKGHDHVISALVEHGAVLNPMTVSGETPLSLARANGRRSTVELLESLQPWYRRGIFSLLWEA